jgi:Protein of unknown function (DUF2914)
MRTERTSTIALLAAGLVAGLGALSLSAPRAVAQDSTATAAPAPTVVAAAVGTSIADRMPADTASSFAPDVGKLYAWAKIQGATGTTIHDVWFHGDQQVADVSLNVSTSPWRGWSTKNILPTATGAWRVEIRDASGNVLATLHFTIGS